MCPTLPLTPRCAAVVCVFVSMVAAAAMAAQPNVIEQENQREGTRDWLLTKVDTVVQEIDPTGYATPRFVRSTKIEAYASQTSYAKGDTVTLFVSTDPASEFTINVYRMGYYGGAGAREVWSGGPIAGKPQPTPEDGERALREAKWAPAVDFKVPEDWVSGVYLAKLTRADGWQSYAIFVVKDDRRADFNFQVSDLTWQAYNRWPAWRSLYDFEKLIWVTSGGNIVSFDRPYTFYYNLLPSKLNPLTNGSGEFLLWEFPLAFWMEQHGYDVTYTSNLDTHTDAAGLLRTKAFLSVGHDEYWTRQMYDHVTRARDAGVNLLFLSGNAVDGEIFLTTSLDGRPNRVFGRAKWFPDEQQLLGASSYGVGLGDWVVRRADHWMYAGTDLKDGDTIKDLVGWEYHGIPLRDDPTLVVLSEAKFTQVDDAAARQAATIYDGPKGNFVFNAGTCWWSMLLSTPPGFANPPNKDFSKSDPRVQRITQNLFARARAGEGPRPPGH